MTSLSAHPGESRDPVLSRDLAADHLTTLSWILGSASLRSLSEDDEI